MISLKKAASQLLKWNLEGQKHATPRRGDWINRNETNDGCTACKIGLVMVGRYGLDKAVNYHNNARRLTETLSYGPKIACPSVGCTSADYRGANLWATTGKHALGSVIEHLFEHHKWSVMRIDKWLAEVAGEKLERR